MLQHGDPAAGLFALVSLFVELAEGLLLVGVVAAARLVLLVHADAQEAAGGVP